MKHHESIEDFFEYRRSVEKERPILTAEQNLITIDGVDGVGKSAIAQKLAEKLKKHFGDERVLLVKITNFRGGSKSKRLNTLAQQGDIRGSRLDMFYEAGINRAYEEIIIPALNEGKMVLVDRSEIDLLRYVVEHDNEIAIERRKRQMEDGTLTHRYWAANRIFLEINPKDLMENLKSRESDVRHVHKSLKEIEVGLVAQKEAEQYTESLPHVGDIKIIREKVIRIENDKERERYFDALAEKIIANLQLGEQEKKML